MKVVNVTNASHGLGAGETGRLVIAGAMEKESFPDHRHDLAQAILRLETALGMMSQGFDFTTPEGGRLLAQLREAVAVVKTEATLLKEIYRDE
jgi:hypothetical protein